jgi:replicative DNA helicase
MNKYLNDLKNITENYQNFAQDNELKSNLQKLVSVMENETAACQPGKISNEANKMLSEFLHSSSSEKFIPTGFKEIDTKKGGLKKGEFVVIGGRPGMGKTALMLQLTLNIAKQHKAVSFFSLDTNNELITQKFLSNLADLNFSVFNDKSLLDSESETKLKEALNTLTTLPVFLYTDKTIYLNDIIKQIKHDVIEHKVEAVLIDMLQLINHSRFGINRDTEVTFICNELKKLANDLNISIVVSSHVSRKAETNRRYNYRARICDLKESSSLEQLADKIIFLYRPTYYGLEIDETGNSTLNVMELTYAKDKTGEIEFFLLSVDLAKPSLADIIKPAEMKYYCSSNLD